MQGNQQESLGLIGIQLKNADSIPARGLIVAFFVTAPG